MKEKLFLIRIEGLKIRSVDQLQEYLMNRLFFEPA